MTRRPARERLPTIDCASAAAWQAWLARHHDSATEVWLVFHRRHTGRPTIDYDAAVCEALCYGWVDSLIMKLDEDRYARKFTPRRPDSRWSSSNRDRYERMRTAGRLAAAGRRLAPTARDGDAMKPSLADLPPLVDQALRQHPAARRAFDGLPPSHRRQYLAWITSARREDTQRRRLDKAVQLLSARKRLGLV